MTQQKITIDNPFRGTESFPMPADIPVPSIRADLAQGLLSRCPAYLQTPLVDHIDPTSGARLFFKDERDRMGLGSFKALGAAYVIAHTAQHQDVGVLSTIRERRGLTQ